MDSSASTNINQQQQNEEDDANEEEEEETPPASTQMNSTTALLFNALQQTLTNNKGGQRNGWSQKTQQRSSFLENLADQLQKSSAQGGVTSKQIGLNLNGSASGNGAKATTCPECGKHVRKRKLLSFVGLKIGGLNWDLPGIF
jgi:hypothetical protein